MAEPSEAERAAMGVRAREELDRKRLTSLTVGTARLTGAFAAFSAAQGPWNLFLCFLGAAILIAVVVVNVYF